MQDVLSKVRAAVDRYEMIAENDVVAVGVSGGKDSMLLLAALAELRRFYPHPFTLKAITVDPRFGGKDGDYAAIAAFCKERGIPYIVHPTELYKVVFEDKQEKNPCSLCARMRRGILHRVAVENGCNTVALGHHEDDAAETFLMNLLSGSTLSCFSPVSFLDRQGIKLIRPLIFLNERQVKAAANRLQLPIVKSSCPVDGDTNRKRMREILESLQTDTPDVAHRIVAAMQKEGLSRW